VLEMSKDFQKAFLALKRKADAGDPRAKAEMSKLLSSPQFKSALSQIKAAKSAALAMIDQTASDVAEDVVGAEEEADDLISGDELERADHVGRLLPPGSDSLDHKAALRKHRLHNLTAVAPFVRSNIPPSAVGQMIGNQVQITSGDIKDVARFVGTDEETTPITVLLGLSELPVINAVSQTQDPVRAFAVVQAGTKGFSIQFEVDIGLGCQFTINASSLYLRIGQPVGSPQGPSLPVTYVASGMLSFLPPLRTKPITRTVYWDTTIGSNASSGRVVIPAFAKDVVVILGNAAHSAKVDFFDSQNNTVAEYAIATSTPQVVPYPLPASAIAFAVTDTSAAGQPSFQAQFGLDL
jgi:hypothetical protein